MLHLTYAMHTMQDSTSPKHHDFIAWTGEEEFSQKREHVLGEIYFPDKRTSYFARATRDVIEMFLGRQEIPDRKVDIFKRYGADSDNRNLIQKLMPVIRDDYFYMR